MSEAQSDPAAVWAEQFSKAQAAWVLHQTRDPLDDAESAALHALLLEALMRSIGVAKDSIAPEHRGPLLYMINALQAFIQGSPDGILRPVARPATGNGVGRPGLSAIRRVIAAHAVLAARLLVEKGGWPAAKADALVAEELTRLLPSTARQDRVLASTVAGWRRGRNDVLLAEHRSWIAAQLASIPAIDAEKARTVSRALLAEQIGKLPI